MLNIHIPLRLPRATVQRCSQLDKERTQEPENVPQAENNDLIPVDQSYTQENKQKRESLENEPDRIYLFFRGVARAAAIGLVVALILAAMPWFEPDIQPFQARLADFVQQYAIPICSAILIWNGVRAAL